MEAMYGLLLVLDPDNPDAEIPPTGNDCSSTDSCVAVPVRAYVDGPVQVWLGPSTASAAGIEVFAGFVETPSRKLAVTVPEVSEPIIVDVTGSTSKIRIVVDDPAYVTSVSVGVDEKRVAPLGEM